MTYLNRKGLNQNAIRPAARAYLQTLHHLEEAGASESHENGGSEHAESLALYDREVAPVEPAQANSQTPRPLQPLGAGAIASLNKINLNAQGDFVHINAVLDLRGVGVLEKKLATLKLLLEADPNLEQDDREAGTQAQDQT